MPPFAELYQAHGSLGNTVLRRIMLPKAPTCFLDSDIPVITSETGFNARPLQ